MVKQRVHNEWFQPIAKKRCRCGIKTSELKRLGMCDTIFSWGEYVSGKWRTVDYFCQGCFPVRVIPRLVIHAGGCGCDFKMNPRMGYIIPSWIKMPEVQSCKAA